MDVGEELGRLSETEFEQACGDVMQELSKSSCKFSNKNPASHLPSPSRQKPATPLMLNFWNALQEKNANEFQMEQAISAMTRAFSGSAQQAQLKSLEENDRQSVWDRDTQSLDKLDAKEQKTIETLVHSSFKTSQKSDFRTLAHYVVQLSDTAFPQAMQHVTDLLSTNRWTSACVASPDPNEEGGMTQDAISWLLRGLVHQAPDRKEWAERLFNPTPVSPSAKRAKSP